MVGKYKVITLCGSTRFKEQFLEAQKRLTLEGNIVISVGLFGHSGDEEVWTEGTKEMLDDMHKRKIDMADSIYVINVGGYIGSSTRSEIEYAIKNGKEVRYLAPLTPARTASSAHPTTRTRNRLKAASGAGISTGVRAGRTSSPIKTKKPRQHYGRNTTSRSISNGNQEAPCR